MLSLTRAIIYLRGCLKVSEPPGFCSRLRLRNPGFKHIKKTTILDHPNFTLIFGDIKSIIKFQNCKQKSCIHPWIYLSIILLFYLISIHLINNLHIYLTFHNYLLTFGLYQMHSRQVNIQQLLELLSYSSVFGAAATTQSVCQNFP